MTRAVNTVRGPMCTSTSSNRMRCVTHITYSDISVHLSEANSCNFSQLPVTRCWELHARLTVISSTFIRLQIDHKVNCELYGIFSFCVLLIYSNYLSIWVFLNRNRYPVIQHESLCFDYLSDCSVARFQREFTIALRKWYTCRGSIDLLFVLLKWKA